MTDQENNHNRSGRTSVLILAGLLILSLVLNLWGISYGLPNRYYPDEGRLVNNALAFGMGDLNPHYFNYPALAMYLLFGLYGTYFILGHLAGIFASAADFQLLFFSDPSSFYLIGRAANALAGTATVFLLYQLGKETYRDRRIGLLAAALLATLPYFVYYSHFIITDILQLAFVLGSYIFVIRILRTAQLKNYFWAGALAGLGTATKYSPAVLILPIVLAHVLRLVEHRNEFTISRLIFPAAFSGFCLVFFFFLGSPYNFLDYRNFLDSLQFRSLLGEHGTWGTGTGNAWLLYPRIIFVHRFTLLNRFDPIGIVLVGGMVWAAARRKKEDLLFLIYPLLVYLMMGSWSFGSNRYSLPVVIFLVLWGARAVVGAGRILGSKIPREGLRRLVVGGINGFISLVLILSLANSVLGNLRLTSKDTRTRAREWIEANIPPGTKIALEWDTEATVQLWETPDDIRAKIRAYETGEAATIHHTSEQMAKVHRMRLNAVPELNYRIVRIGGMDGIRVIPDGYSLEDLRKREVEYLITSSEVTRIFLAGQGPEVYPDHHRFYRRAEEELPLLAVFRPNPLSSLGPEIRIYRVD